MKRLQRSCRHCGQLLAPGFEFTQGEHRKCPNSNAALPQDELNLINQRNRYRKLLLARTRDEWIAAIGPMGFTTFSTLSPELEHVKCVAHSRRSHNWNETSTRYVFELPSSFSAPFRHPSNGSLYPRRPKVRNR